MNQQASKFFHKKTVRDIAVHDKRVLLRADFNVPLDDNGNILSDYRITETIPTIQYLLDRGCIVIMMSHLGRPDGKPDKTFTLAPVAERLQELLPNNPVIFTDDPINDKARVACKNAKAGEIVLLENVRFYPGEEENDMSYAKQLQKTANADLFVQDCFGVAHRAHASIEAITHLLPSVAGLLLEKEVSTLLAAMSKPKHPLVAVVGGAKISDKIGFIEKLLDIADTVLVGGAMANTFLKYQGYDVGKSKFEEGQEEVIKNILQKAKPDQLVLPTDVAVTTDVSVSSQRRDCSINEVQSEEAILDIGFETMRHFAQCISSANTVIWNGTLGYAELPQFAQGSEVLAKSMTEQADITSVVGGGDTADFALNWLTQNTGRSFTHISTGGGASLELMSGLKLPGVEALLS